MKQTVSLFIPCFVDQLLPQVAVDTVKVLRRLDYGVEYPEDQTCCGQPAFNTGYWDEARPCAEHFVKVFKHADVVVCPSGSCATMIRIFYADLLAKSSSRDDALSLASRTFELSEFLVKVAGVTQVGAVFPHRVTYHASCHGLRELKLRDEPLQLLRQVRGLTLIEMARSEECCGFGGTFAAKFSDISAAMGTSKAESVAATGAEFVTAIDPSCLLHLEGILGKRQAPTRTIHLASILAQQDPSHQERA
ncbi:MAG: (Fe-S)-binding protein [Candidatus Sulfotelmatobacter sp.]